MPQAYAFAAFLSSMSRRTPREHAKTIWKLVAFLGRYGNQQVDQLLEMQNSELIDMADAIAELMREEADAMKRPGL